VLVDIGANVGMYTIWAAKTRNARVFAFEPESQNYAVLNRNIARNGLHDRVLDFFLSLSDAAGFGTLQLSQFGFGGSVHQFSSGAGTKRVGYLQGSCSSTLDILVADGVVPVPDYVKIDVDGLEPRIVKGARKTFADPRVKSVLIEVDTRVESHWEMVDLMLELGFDYDPQQVERAQRKEGPFQGVGNYVFKR
jgi:FkbM family methyltransferase